METYLKSLGEDVWFSVASRYNALKKPKTTAQKETKRNNKLAIDTILDGLTDSVKSKVGSCASTKEIWDKLQELYARKEAEAEEELITTSQISKKKIEEIMEGLKNFVIERTPESENVSHEIHDEDTRKVNQEWRNSNFGLKTNHVPKINMWKFDGNDPITWILQMEQFFDLHNVPHTRKV
jgi:hypothetical protein